MKVYPYWEQTALEPERRQFLRILAILPIAELKAFINEHGVMKMRNEIQFFELPEDNNGRPHSEVRIPLDFADYSGFATILYRITDAETTYRR